MSAIRILFGAAFVWFWCVAAGQLLFRAIRLKLPSREAVFLGFLTGAALVSTAMFGLASARLVYTKVLVIGGLGTIAAWIWFCRPVLRRDPNDELPRLWRWAFWIPLAVYGCLYVFAAMMPETSADGTVYHVGLISRYYDHRGFMAMPDDMFAGLPQGIEMLFWIGFAFGRHSAAAMVHLLFWLAMPFGMRAFGSRIGKPKAGVVAALLFCLAPVAGKDATIAYIDTGMAVVAFGAVYCLWLWREAEYRAALVPAGLLAGFCYACKVTGGVAIPFAIGVVLLRRAWRSAAVVALLAAAVAVPWMVKSAVLFHNPFFPLMNRMFPNPYLYPMTEDTLRAIVKHVGNVPYSRLPYQVIVGGGVIGILGPVFFLAPLALLSLRSHAGRFCMLASAVFGIGFFLNTETRFLLPCLPFLSFAMALGLLSIPRAGARLALTVCALHAYLAWPGEVQRWLPGYQWRVDMPDWRAALRIVPEKQWLSEHWGEYDAGLLLDRYVKPGEKVYSPNMGQIAYHHRDLVGTFESALAVRIYNVFVTPTSEGWATPFHRTISFAPVDTRKIRLQSAIATDNELRLYEVRFFDGDREIARDPAWRLTASRNPWEVGFAFDGSPVSWWTSARTVDPQTWIEVDFPRAVHLDRIEVDQVTDQAGMVLYPLAEVNGAWVRLQSKEVSGADSQRKDLRMALADEMKAAGIRWILIRDDAYGAADLRDKSPYWGASQIAETHGFRLWRLD